MPRKDPYPSFRFNVEIDNIKFASFSEVRGLQIEIETEPYKEGGVNNFEHTFPKRAKYQPLVLKRGISGLEGLDELRRWYMDVVMNGKINRKNVTVVLLDAAGNERRRWNFKGAYPVKWTGPELKADSNAIAIESIELVHQGMTDS